MDGITKKDNRATRPNGSGQLNLVAKTAKKKVEQNFDWEFGKQRGRSFKVAIQDYSHHVRIPALGILTLAVLVLSLFLFNSKTLKSAVAHAGSGIDSLFEGSSLVLTSPQKALASFDVSAASFESSAAALQELDSISKSLFVFPYARESLQLLRIGHHASLAGEALTQAFADFPQDEGGSFEDTISKKASAISVWQSQHQENFKTALGHLSAMKELFKKVDADKLPKNLSSKITDWQAKIPTMYSQAQALVNLASETPDLFGTNGPRRFVILFQNNTELRPTGGFIGSYATLEFDQLSLKNFFVQTNVWKSDTAFSARFPITPPYPLSEATTVWAMRDANWNASFPDTAKQVLEFYQKMYGAPAHGVVAIDTSIILDLLRITGPIEFPEYDTSLDQNNFLDIVQYKVEIEYFENKANKVDNEPKQIISDFIPKLFTKIKNLDEEQTAAVNQILVEAMSRKSIQLYFNNSIAEQAVVDLDIAGQIKDTNSDYLYINNANIGGGKSSLNVTQEVKIKQKTAAYPLENTIEITRTHHSNGVWPDADNVNYMRIYVPKNSTLLNTEGSFELHETLEENGKTVFAGWFNTDVASKKFASITYRLPDRIDPKNYSLLIQRQPGANPDTIDLNDTLLDTGSLILNQDTLLTN